jgi:hypothetical protein
MREGVGRLFPPLWQRGNDETVSEMHRSGSATLHCEITPPIGNAATCPMCARSNGTIQSSEVAIGLHWLDA